MCSKTFLLLRAKTNGWMAHLQRSREEQKKKEREREIYVAGRMKTKQTNKQKKTEGDRF